MNKQIILLVLLIIVLLGVVLAWYWFDMLPEGPDAPHAYESISLAVRYAVQFVYLALRMPHSGDVQPPLLLP